MGSLLSKSKRSCKTKAKAAIPQPKDEGGTGESVANKEKNAEDKSKHLDLAGLHYGDKPTVASKKVETEEQPKGALNLFRKTFGTAKSKIRPDSSKKELPCETKNSRTRYNIFKAGKNELTSEIKTSDEAAPKGIVTEKPAGCYQGGDKDLMNPQPSLPEGTVNTTVANGSSTTALSHVAEPTIFSTTNKLDLLQDDTKLENLDDQDAEGTTSQKTIPGNLGLAHGPREMNTSDFVRVENFTDPDLCDQDNQIEKDILDMNVDDRVRSPLDPGANEETADSVICYQEVVPADTCDEIGSDDLDEYEVSGQSKTSLKTDDQIGSAEEDDTFLTDQGREKRIEAGTSENSIPDLNTSSPHRASRPQSGQYMVSKVPSSTHIQEQLDGPITKLIYVRSREVLDTESDEEQSGLLDEKDFIKSGSETSSNARTSSVDERDKLSTPHSLRSKQSIVDRFEQGMPISTSATSHESDYDEQQGLANYLGAGSTNNNTDKCNPRSARNNKTQIDMTEKRASQMMPQNSAGSKLSASSSTSDEQDEFITVNSARNKQFSGDMTRKNKNQMATSDNVGKVEIEKVSFVGPVRTTSLTNNQIDMNMTDVEVVYFKDIPCNTGGNQQNGQVRSETDVEQASTSKQQNGKKCQSPQKTDEQDYTLQSGRKWLSPRMTDGQDCSLQSGRTSQSPQMTDGQDCSLQSGRTSQSPQMTDGQDCSLQSGRTSQSPQMTDGQDCSLQSGRTSQSPQMTDGQDCSRRSGRKSRSPHMTDGQPSRISTPLSGRKTSGQDSRTSTPKSGRKTDLPADMSDISTLQSGNNSPSLPVIPPSATSDNVPVLTSKPPPYRCVKKKLNKTSHTNVSNSDLDKTPSTHDIDRTPTTNSSSQDLATTPRSISEYDLQTTPWVSISDDVGQKPINDECMARVSCSNTSSQSMVNASHSYTSYQEVRTSLSNTSYVAKTSRSSTTYVVQASESNLSNSDRVKTSHSNANNIGGVKTLTSTTSNSRKVKMSLSDISNGNGVKKSANNIRNARKSRSSTDETDRNELKLSTPSSGSNATPNDDSTRDAQGPKICDQQTPTTGQSLTNNAERMTTPHSITTFAAAACPAAKIQTETENADDQREAEKVSADMNQAETPPTGNEGAADKKEGQGMILMLLGGDATCDRDDANRGAGDGADVPEEKAEADERANRGIATMLDDRSKSSCQLEGIQAEQSWTVQTLQSLRLQLVQTSQLAEDGACATDELQTNQTTEGPLAREEPTGALAEDQEVTCNEPAENNLHTPDRKKSSDGVASTVEDVWEMVPAQRVYAQTNLGNSPGSMGSQTNINEQANQDDSSPSLAEQEGTLVTEYTVHPEDDLSDVDHMSMKAEHSDRDQLTEDMVSDAESFQRYENLEHDENEPYEGDVTEMTEQHGYDAQNELSEGVGTGMTEQHGNDAQDQAAGDLSSTIPDLNEKTDPAQYETDSE